MVDKWTVSQVRDWLNDQGFWSYSNLLCDIHKIDGKALLMLKESDLRSPPILIETPLGDLKRLYLAIHTIQKEQRKENGILSQEHAYRRRELSSISSWSDDLQSINRDTGDGYISEELDPELWKTALSFIYAFAVCLLTSFVMVIVHDRVPDMERYPPLPDLVLDNVPLIPKAFDICEGIIITLCVIWGLILLFHRHRFILLRRFFSLGGTVFLLRCVTMLITSLSVPGVHLNCKPHQNKDLVSQFWRAVEIWKCFGMSLRGARSCGDYMFSGHTVCLTLLNFFITEYTSRRLYYLHTFTWVLNMFGIFFILAAHEHYSIDVFIAFYISSRLFVYYHTLANNRTLATADEMKTRINFPLFVFFESKCCGAVPNVFLWPLPWPCSLQRLFNNSKKQQ